MNTFTGTVRGSTKRRRALAAATAAVVAATVAPLLGAQPAAAANSCTNSFRVRDLTMYACWEWNWVGTPGLYWRPSALRIRPTDSGKSYFVTVLTNSWKSPSSVALGEKRGPANWGVPSTYDWTMYWRTESTTTRIVRPGPNGNCTALVRHDGVVIDSDPHVRVLSITGAC